MRNDNITNMGGSISCIDYTETENKVAWLSLENGGYYLASILLE